MKRTIFTLLGLLMITSASAEDNEYVPLVREGVVWEYVGYHQEDSYTELSPDCEYLLYTLALNGTREIDGLMYYDMYRTNYDSQGNPLEPYLVTCLREENRVVLSLKNDYDYNNVYFNDVYYWWEMPGTLYDFNKPMFLPEEAYDCDEAPYDYALQNYSSIEVEVGGSVRRGYNIYDNNDFSGDLYFKSIEGIGVDCNFGDLLIPYRSYIMSGINPLAGLSAVYENGELVYKGCMYDIAQQLKNPAVNGDVDGDGIVTSTDVTALYNYLLNGDETYVATSDIDGDGSVTSADVTAVYNILLGE